MPILQFCFNFSFLKLILYSNCILYIRSRERTLAEICSIKTTMKVYVSLCESMRIYESLLKTYKKTLEIGTIAGKYSSNYT